MCWNSPAKARSPPYAAGVGFSTYLLFGKRCSHSVILKIQWASPKLRKLKQYSPSRLFPGVCSKGGWLKNTDAWAKLAAIARLVKKGPSYQRRFNLLTLSCLTVLTSFSQLIKAYIRACYWQLEEPVGERGAKWSGRVKWSPSKLTNVHAEK